MYLTSTCISSIISSFIPIPFISVILICMLNILIVLNNRYLQLFRSDVSRFVFLGLFVLFSFFFNGGKSFDYLLHFFVFGISALLISNIVIDGYRVIKYVIFIYTLYCIVYFLKIQHVFVGDDANQMGLAYSCVPGVLVGHIALSHKNEFNRKIIFLSLFVILCSTWIILFKTITRGAILSAILGILFIYYIGTNKNKRKRVVLSFLITIPIALYFIIEAFSSINNSSIGAVNKLLIMMEGGDVSNGRYELWESAFKIILKNPLLGYGAGFFEKNNDSSYPHQFFLQILCEFGFIGSLIILIPLYLKFKRILNNNAFWGNLLFAVYFVYAFILLMFSSSYWLFPIFWFLFFNNSLFQYKIFNE